VRSPLGLTVNPSTPGFGAEIGGVDLSIAPTRELRDALYRLLCCRRVLFFRDQHLSTQQQISFAEVFGPILTFRSVVPADPHHPEVHHVDGSTVGWHIDASGRIDPPVATVLSAVETPASGGDTIWADGVAAYRGLPGELKRRLEGTCATHTAPADHPLVAHPVAPIYPVTGERYLYINLAPWVDTRILGMSADDSKALVGELRDRYLQPKYQLRFCWSTGTTAIWDNRVVQHTGIRDYGEGVRRRLTRICIARFAH
jgi:alpha-ketoglutarate-dependent taurine dioxygenase